MRPRHQRIQCGPQLAALFSQPIAHAVIVQQLEFAQLLEPDVQQAGVCDALHADCTIDDALWSALRTHFSEEAMLELLMLAGFYRTVSYLTNALKLPLEPGAARFASVQLSGSAPGSPG